MLAFQTYSDEGTILGNAAIARLSLSSPRPGVALSANRAGHPSRVRQLFPAARNIHFVDGKCWMVHWQQ